MSTVKIMVSITNIWRCIEMNWLKWNDASPQIHVLPTTTAGTYIVTSHGVHDWEPWQQSATAARYSSLTTIIPVHFDTRRKTLTYTIGVARGCTVCTYSPGARKNGGVKFAGKSCKFTPRQRMHPEAEQESNFLRKSGRYGRGKGYLGSFSVCSERDD